MLLPVRACFCRCLAGRQEEGGGAGSLSACLSLPPRPARLSAIEGLSVSSLRLWRKLRRDPSEENPPMKYIKRWEGVWSIRLQFSGALFLRFCILPPGCHQHAHRHWRCVRVLENKGAAAVHYCNFRYWRGGEDAC